MLIRDRIKDFRRVPARSLRPNPKNWRTHPKAQQDALRGILAEVGFADALLARELPDGTLELVDGHLRAETTPDQTVPVLVLDVSEAEADKLLASLDPLAAMAEASASKLAELMARLNTESPALKQMLDDLANREGAVPDAGPPTLEEIEAEYGEAAEEDLWPEIRLRVAPDTERRFSTTLERFPGERPNDKLLALLERVA